MECPSLSVVVPTHNTRELTLRCLASLADGGAAPADVVVVDDASSDGTAGAVRSAFPEVTVVEIGRNLGFGAAANLGVTHTRGDVVLLLNSDTELLEGALAALTAAFADDPSLGIGGAELFDPDGRPQWRAGRRPTPLWLFVQASGLAELVSGAPGRRIVGPLGAQRSGAVDWVSGAAMAIRRAVWESRGPLDEGYRFYCQDLDLCIAAAAAGWTVAVIPAFCVLHHRGATIGATQGASAGLHPAHLWADLVRYAGKVDGAAAARRAVLAIRSGARLRLAGRALAAPFKTGSKRAAWDRESEAFRQGLAELVEPDLSLPNS